jgi:hypothetical protein
MIIRKSQVHKFPCCPSPQIANPQISKEKTSVCDPDLHSFASNFFLPTERKYILDYEMSRNFQYCPKSQKSSLNLNESIFLH